MSRPNAIRPGFSLIELVVVVAIIGIMSSLTLSAVQRVRAAAAKLKCQNNLRQIGLAAHQHHDARGSLPAGIVWDKPSPAPRWNGWQFHLLPFLDQQSLWEYSMGVFRSDRFPFRVPPHDGLRTIIQSYLCPSDSRVFDTPTLKGHPVAFTSYLGIAGTDRESLDGVLFPDSSIRLTSIRDGTSNTLLVGERPPSANLLFGWWYAGIGQDNRGSADMLLGVRERRVMHPDLLLCPRGPYHFGPGSEDNQCDALHYWSMHSGGANFLFCDGAVRFLSYSADSIMPALATRAGGERVTVPD